MPSKIKHKGVLVDEVHSNLIYGIVYYTISILVRAFFPIEDENSAHGPINIFSVICLALYSWREDNPKYDKPTVSIYIAVLRQWISMAIAAATLIPVTYVYNSKLDGHIEKGGESLIDIMLILFLHVMAHTGVFAIFRTIVNTLRLGRKIFQK